MIKQFSEKFKELINEDVSRTFLYSYENDTKDYTTNIEHYPIPKDGFIANYCTK